VLALLPEQWAPYAAVVVAILTAATVYAIPNAQTDPAELEPSPDGDQPEPKPAG
jgi:hypothetical protein